MDTVTFPGDPGLLWMTPPGHFHAENSRTGYRNLNFTVTLPSDLTFPLWIRDDEDAHLGTFCRNILQELQFPRAGRSPLPLLLNTLLIYVEQSQQQPPVRHTLQTVQKAEALMKTRFQEKISMEELARHCGVSGATLRSHFQKERQHSPQEALHRIRLQHARYLLQTSTLPLEAIASLSGFHSASHLSHRFALHFQSRPGQFRKRLTQEKSPPSV